MNSEHVLSDELLQMVLSELDSGNPWVAYNSMNYFLDKGDLYCFRTSDEAHEFAADNISDKDSYKVIHAFSVDELFKQLPYGERLEQQLTNPDANGLYNPDGNAFTDLLIDHLEQQQLSNEKNMSIMNEKNFDYLKDNLKYMGFGEKIADALQANLKEGKESFQLQYAVEVNKKPFEAILQFRKSDSSDMYFLNSYKASLKRSNGDTMEQTFYLEKGKGVTAKEAFNLLEGRAVQKEFANKGGEPYKAWIQLDFDVKDNHPNHEMKKYHENYGYDLRAAIAKYPVKELDGGELEKNLLQSLQKGNVQTVTVVANGKDQRIFIEANPKYKTVNVFNEKMQRLDQSQRQELMQKPEVTEGRKQGKEKDKGRELGQEDQPGKKQSRSRKVSEGAGGEGVGLIEKKRTGTNKGMGI